MPSQPPAAPDASPCEYRPDPGRETGLVINSFLDALTAREPDAAAFQRRVRGRHRDLINAQAERAGDEHSWVHLKTVLVLVAAYQELRERYPGQDLVPRLREAFVEPVRPYVARATSEALEAATDPFSAMVAITKERERSFFGDSFTFDHPVDDGNRYVAEVHRCFYHDVLAASDAAQLTPILCAFDATWIDVIDPSRHGFWFERPATIGTGGVTCPFTFTRNPGSKS